MSGYSYIGLKSRVRALLACGLFLAAPLLPARLRPDNRGKTRVLVFHHLDQPARFRAILQLLQKHYNLISFGQYLANDKAADRLNLIIALDDGYRSWFTAGLPIFTELGIKPLLFVNSDFVGLDETAALAYCREHIHTWPEASLSWEQLNQLVAAGAEVGGHTHHHTNLVKADAATALQAVTADRALLAAQLGAAPRLFAYPFGLHNNTAAAAVAEAGYDYAFTSDSAHLEDSATPHLLKRMNVGLRPPLLARAMAEGWADHITALMAILRGKRSAACASTSA